MACLIPGAPQRGRTEITPCEGGAYPVRTRAPWCKPGNISPGPAVSCSRRNTVGWAVFRRDPLCSVRTGTP